MQFNLKTKKEKVRTLLVISVVLSGLVFLGLLTNIYVINNRVLKTSVSYSLTSPQKYLAMIINEQTDLDNVKTNHVLNSFLTEGYSFKNVSAVNFNDSNPDQFVLSFFNGDLRNYADNVIGSTKPAGNEIISCFKNYNISEKQAIGLMRIVEDNDLINFNKYNIYKNNAEATNSYSKYFITAKIPLNKFYKDLIEVFNLYGSNKYLKSQVKEILNIQSESNYNNFIKSCILAISNERQILAKDSVVKITIGFSDKGFISYVSYEFDSSEANYGFEWEKSKKDDEIIQTSFKLKKYKNVIAEIKLNDILDENNLYRGQGEVTIYNSEGYNNNLNASDNKEVKTSTFEYSNREDIIPVI